MNTVNVTQQQHTSTATSILTTKSTYHSLSAQRLSERTVLLDSILLYTEYFISDYTVLVVGR